MSNPKVPIYGWEVWDTAMIFVSGTNLKNKELEGHCDKLATLIQHTIEDYLETIPKSHMLQRLIKGKETDK